MSASPCLCLSRLLPPVPDPRSNSPTAHVQGVCSRSTHPFLKLLIHPCIYPSSVHASIHHPSMHLSIIHPCIYPSSIHASIHHPSMHLSIIHPCIYPSSIHASIHHPSMHLSIIHPCIYPSSIHASIHHPSMHLSIIHPCFYAFMHTPTRHGDAPLQLSPACVLQYVPPRVQLQWCSFFHPFTHQFIYPSIHQSTHPSTHQFIHSSIHQSTHS